MSKRDRSDDEIFSEIEDLKPIIKKKIPKPIKTVPITFSIEKLEDLIKLGELYDPNFQYDCPINLKHLNNIVEPLKELNNLIGLSSFKESIINQLIFQLSTIGETDYSERMLHTVLLGSPGTGKTTCARIMGKIYAKMGYLTKGHFVSVKRADLIGKWLGHTAANTTKILEEARGGVLFIDEAYSLGNARQDDGDSFSKECIDTINQFLSENARDFICILAGYKEEVEKCFFAHNPGLERRFPYRFTIEGYSPSELFQIFNKLVSDDGWSFEEQNSITEDFFHKNKDKFPHYGGDLIVFLDACKVIHTRRTFILSREHWRKLSKQDISKALENYEKSKGIKNETIPLEVRHMYL